MCRYEEAYTECQRAIRLEPLSSANQYALGCVYWMARRYDQAIEQLEKALPFDASFPWGHGFIGFSYQGKCIYEPAVAAMQKAVELSPGSTLALLGLSEAYVLAGRREEAEKVLEQVEKLSKQQYIMPYYRARVCAALGQRDDTLHWLETSYHERTSQLAFLKVDPHFDALRSVPRFQELLNRMNFPP